jgi:hypothetical protein
MPIDASEIAVVVEMHIERALIGALQRFTNTARQGISVV